jgi:hypothetical protein
MMNNRRYARGVNEEAVALGVAEPAIQFRPRHIHTKEAVLVEKEMALHFDNVSSSYDLTGDKKS